MLFAILAVALLLIELLYFKIAERLKIIDKPNERSSHRNVTLRGGGIIFPISLFIYYFFFGFQYPWFTLGLLIISIISFADDIKPQSHLLRFSTQLVAVLLLMYEVNYQELYWYWWLISLVMIIGVLNACNFMDGINGIISGYAFTVLGALWLLNQELQLFDNNFIYCIGIANLVFGYFNFRNTARCFAGDVGSIALGYAMIFLTCMVLLHTGEPIFILFFAVYGVDTVITLFHRILKKENIFYSHRQHLFQFLANEKHISQVKVSLIYIVVQAAISFGVLKVWKMPAINQWVFAIVVLSLLTGVYFFFKFKQIKRSVKARVSGYSVY